MFHSNSQAIITVTVGLQPFSLKSLTCRSFHLSVILKYQAVVHTELMVESLEVYCGILNVYFNLKITGIEIKSSV